MAQTYRGAYRCSVNVYSSNFPKQYRNLLNVHQQLSSNCLQGKNIFSWPFKAFIQFALTPRVEFEQRIFFLNAENGLVPVDEGANARNFCFIISWRWKFDPFWIIWHQMLEFHLPTDTASKKILKKLANLTFVWLIHYRRKGEEDFRRNSEKTLLPLPLNPFFNNLSEDVITWQA